MFNLVEKIDEWFIEGHTFAEGNNHKPSSPDRLNPYPEGSTEALWWNRGYQNSHHMYMYLEILVELNNRSRTENE